MAATTHSRPTLYRGPLYTPLDTTAPRADGAELYLPDGGLLVVDGLIGDVGLFEAVRARAGAAYVVDTGGHWLVPGFVDTHVHYPQTEMIASFGAQLLDWLNTYTFPAEAAFADRDHADRVARLFLDEMLRQGTTTALVFATVHPGSVDALFSAALKRDLRLIAGKVCMDRHAPANLLDTPESAYEDSARLIDQWHGRGRLGYAITPRFAPTSSPAQLAALGRLLHAHDDVLLHTHLSENQGEIAWVADLFPEAQSYLDVYDRHDLVGERSVFAHCLHMADHDMARLGRAGSAIACCPTSNFFLGSGTFDFHRAERHDVTVGLGSDVGAGTSFSLTATMNAAYKAGQLQGQALTAGTLMRMATLDGARALHVADRVGSLEPGKEADFLTLNPAATPLMAARMAAARDWREQLFALIMMGDDRMVSGTHIRGRRWQETAKA
ncbi:guanine deaminase [Yunchengibacter salinarum]|uniref:guanine deaminase n=1 Tax=Yunchengibacter salinarum TaxID=3133399 RepID=UPI0035B5E46F